MAELLAKYLPTRCPELRLLEAVDGKLYQIVDGVYFYPDTPLQVINWLNTARYRDMRIRLFYGDTETGRDWMEESEVMGYIGRTGGKISKPILLCKSSSSGGGMVLDNRIVRITLDKRDVYRHPNYHQPTLEVREICETYHDKTYRAGVFAEGVNIANFETLKKAKQWMDFMKGERNNY